MRRLAIFAATVVLVCAGSLRAQTTSARVTGRITDSTKAIIPNLDVTLTNVDTNIRTSGTTNETGTYYVTDLPAGSNRNLIYAPRSSQFSSCEVPLCLVAAINGQALRSAGVQTRE
jgi:Carboxypeptidase regulatory-like domain